MTRLSGSIGHPKKMPAHLSILSSRALLGARVIPVSVEIHLGNGLPQFNMVGLPDTEVRESRERVRVALLANGFEFPQRRITVNLAPADLPKESGRFDLPIALGILIASQQLPNSANHLEFAGELALDGQLRPIRGALAMAVATHREGRTLVLPVVSAQEAALHAEASVLSAPSLSAVCAHISGRQRLEHAVPSLKLTEVTHNDEVIPDLSDVRGQLQACQALITAAAGGHSLIFHGPPGCGKTLLAERLPGILPPMSPQEALASAVNRSLAGLPIDPRKWQLRPFRRPHHTTPALAITGGGNPIRPGEISLAHQGVLFLDELPEFSRSSLEALREPLESGEVCISRVAGAEVLPARFQLLATMNPCPCGRGQDDLKPCRCTEARIQAYRSRVSAPILDRIDLWVPVRKESTKTALLETSPSGEVNSKSVREHVLKAREVQLARQGCENARLSGRKLLEVASLNVEAEASWQRIAHSHQLSPRGAHRLLRVARTLADLDGMPTVGKDHLFIASQWRAHF